MKNYFLEPGEVIDRMRSMLKEFTAAQAKLIWQDPHEDAIVDALGPFLRAYFQDFPYDINHNYDLMHSGNEMVKKTGEFLRNELPVAKIPKDIAEDQATIVREMLPDFIFHDVTSGSENFLFIEVKKTTNRRRSARVWDHLKLVASTTGKLDYSYSCFIDIASGEHARAGKPSIFELYVKGEVVHKEPVFPE